MEKKHLIVWSDRIGMVTLAIDKKIVLVSVDMANILLHLQNGSRLVKSLLCEIGYSMD